MDGDGRLVHHRLGDELHQLGLFGELLTFVQKQSRMGVVQDGLEAGELLQTAPQDDEVAGGGVGAHAEAGDGALDVAHGGESLAQFGEEHRLSGEVLHGIQPRLDGGLGLQGTQDPLAQEACAHGGDGLVQHGDEGVVLAVGEDGIHQLEVPLGDAVEHEAVVGLVGGDGGEVRGVLAQGVLGVVEDGAGRADGGFVAAAAIAVQRRDLEMAQEVASCQFDVKMPVLHAGPDQLLREVGREAFVLPAREQTGGGQAFGGLQAVEFDLQRSDAHGDFGDAKLSGGEVERGQPPAVFHRQKRHEVVAAVGLQQRVLHHRARRDDFRDVALHQPLCQLRVLNLVRQGDLVAARQELRDILPNRTVGDAAQWRTRPAGQHDVHQRRGDFGVLEEHLVEVAHPEHQQRVRRELALRLGILTHPRREFARQAGVFGWFGFRHI